MSAAGMDFSGQVVLVTGASRGIGATIARAFAALGAAVVVNYRAQHALAQSVADACRAAGGDGLALQADVTDPAQVDRLVEQALAEFGRIDVLVHNAFAPYAFDPEQRVPLARLDWPSMQRQLDGALGAAFHLARAVLPGMRQRAAGAIVHVATDLVEDPAVAYLDYGTAKAALVGFTRQLAAECGPFGVRVNAVAPGLVHPTSGSAATRAEFRDALAAATPLGRLATPDDVAGPVLFLASRWSGFMTGQLLLVDGGRVMR